MLAKAGIPTCPDSLGGTYIRAKGVSAEERKTIADRNQAREHENQDKLTKAKAYVAGLGNTVGAFEGAGYMAKDM